MTDVFDALAGTEDPDDNEGFAPGDVFVCETIDAKTNSVCGETFDTQGKLNQHAWQRHRIRKAVEDKAPRKKKRSGTNASRTKSRTQAVTETPGATMDRTSAYTAGLGMIALGLYLAPGPFDEYDLSVLNGGAPGLAAALDAVGERNPVVRDTCDLILGGGAGGPYAALIFAVLGIAGPILSHHGVLPASVGERFGGAIGAPPAPVPDGSVSNPQAPGGRVADVSADDIVEMMSPSHVETNAEDRLIAVSGPTVVRGGVETSLDQMTPADIERAFVSGVITERERDELMEQTSGREPGPEQLNPEARESVSA